MKLSNQLFFNVNKGHDYSKDYYPEAITNKTIQSVYNYSVIDFNKETIFDESDIRIISTAIIKNQYDDTSIFFEACNDSENNFALVIEDIYLNDVLVGSGTQTYDAILAGKKAIMSTDLSQLLEYTDEDISTIQKVSNMTFTLCLNDPNTGSTLYSEQIQLDLPNLTIKFDKDE